MTGKKRASKPTSSETTQAKGSDKRKVVPKRPPKKKSKHDDVKEGKKKNKFGAKKCTDADGNRFDSKAELARWEELKLLQRAGEISNLERQKRIRLEVNGKHVCDTIIDFQYMEGGQKVYEDVKGYTKGPAYQLASIKPQPLSTPPAPR